MNEVRLGIIGLSPGPSWGYTAHVPAVASLPDARISAVATTRTESATEAARLVGAEAWFTDAESLAFSEAVDAVVVTVKVPAHERAVKAALAAGKPVFCEWPLAQNCATASALAAEAGRLGLVNAVGLQARNSPGIPELHRLIRGGVLGYIRSVAVQSSRLKGTGNHPIPASYGYTYDADNFAGTREVLGGHLVGMIDHLVGVESLEGRSIPPYPNEVQDISGRTHHVTAPDSFVATGTLTGGGLLSMAWWDRDAAPCCRIVIRGTLGTALIMSRPQGPGVDINPQISPLDVIVTLADGSCRRLEAPAPDLPLPAQNVAIAYRLFLDDLRKGTADSASFADAVRVHRLIDDGIPRLAQ